MDMSVLNTALLDLREELISSTFLQSMEKRNSQLFLEKSDSDEPKVYSRESFNLKQFDNKLFGLAYYDKKSSKDIVSASVYAGFTPIDAIKMNKALNSYALENLVSKNGVELLSCNFKIV